MSESNPQKKTSSMIQRCITGAVLVADQKVTDVDYRIDASQIGPDGLMLRSGKKKFHRIVLK